MIWIISISTFIIGFLIAYILNRKLIKPKDMGWLHVIKEDPEGTPSLWLDLDEPVEEVLKHEYVIFKVSQK